MSRKNGLSVKQFAAALRAKADELERLEVEAASSKKELERENQFMKPERKSGVVPPWDARKTRKPGGYWHRDGSFGNRSRTVCGARWDTLCVCPNEETAEFVAHAINEYLKTVMPETMYVENVEKLEQVLLSDKALKTLKASWVRKQRATA